MGREALCARWGRRFHNGADGGMARYAGARTLAFGGDEKFASERDSNQPRSPSQAEEMMAWEREESNKRSRGQINNGLTSAVLLEGGEGVGEDGIHDVRVSQEFGLSRFLSGFKVRDLWPTSWISYGWR